MDKVALSPRCGLIGGGFTDHTQIRVSQTEVLIGVMAGELGSRIGLSKEAMGCRLWQGGRLGRF
jgi:hypothetical protein